ncbi:MAG: GNAT family N-acetyltransferase [Anaerolineales bacterium]|jgi:ribosomal protein S18 acetylase RimI-like enzyme
MMEIEIRQILQDDHEALARLDHSFHTDYVWQMALEQDERSKGVQFREVRLPRSMRVEYPWPEEIVLEDLTDSRNVLVAEKEGHLVGYINISRNRGKSFASVTDLVVARRLRRQGIGSTLLKAAAAWLKQDGISQMRLEMQPKNHPAINLATKLGFEFCGYSDQYFPNFEIALFFIKKV